MLDQVQDNRSKDLNISACADFAKSLRHISYSENPSKKSLYFS